MVKKASAKPTKSDETAFELADYVRRSTAASNVPLHVEDLTVLTNVAAMVKSLALHKTCPLYPEEARATG